MPVQTDDSQEFWETVWEWLLKRIPFHAHPPLEQPHTRNDKWSFYEIDPFKLATINDSNFEMNEIFKMYKRMKYYNVAKQL